MDWDALPALFPGFPIPERWLPLLQRHAALLDYASARVRVSAVGAADVVQRQYAESLELWRIALSHAAPGPLVDVGSGGGFPGLVIACVAPDVAVALIEPLRKRAALLESLAAELGLEIVTVFAERAEQAGRGELRESAGVVTARAVAELRELVEYVAPLAATGGLIALPKGSRAEEELEAAGSALAELNCEAIGIEPMRPEVSGTLSAVLLRKTGPLADRYPRRAGMPGKRPL